MPGDPIGLTIGVVDLATLFTTCLDCWDFVDAGRSHATNFSLLRTKLDNQRFLFIIWGKKVGFGTPVGYDKRLDDPLIQPILQGNLNHIKLILSNTEDLVKRYGIKMKDAEPEPRDPASRDEKKFDTMVKSLSDLVEDLDKITSGFISYACGEQMAREEIKTINDIVSLQEIQRVAGNAETVISAAASVRQRRIEAVTLESGSTSATLFTAPGSREQAQDSLNIVAAETSQVESSSATQMKDIVRTNNEAIMATVGPFYLPESDDSSIRKFEHYTLSYVERCIAFTLLQMQKTAPDFYSLAPIEFGNLRELLGTFKGPPGSPYDGGIFHVRMKIPSEYPLAPPICWYLTRVYHPNIDEHGAICLDILRENWGPAQTLKGILISIQSLLETPNTQDPFMPEIARQLLSDRAAFEATARAWTRKYATGEIIYPGTRSDGFLIRPSYLVKPENTSQFSRGFNLSYLLLGNLV